MTAFTRLGSSLWDWPPFVDLDDGSRILWLAFYTTAEAKRHAPGLWQGGIPTMADAARQHPDLVISSLDKLLERDLVEYDPKTRVLRLCALPDPGEFPSNGKVIRSWWTRFKSVPECGVRDAHVVTLRWIIDTGSKLSGKEVTPNHEEAWRTTFGTVLVPAPRRRGVRRLTDSDTSTALQPSLFAPPSAPYVPTGNGIGYGIAYGMGDANRIHPPPHPVDNSDVVRQLNKNNTPETVSDTVSDTNRIPDPGSRIPDLLSDSGEGGRGGGHDSSNRRVLSLVPPPLPYTASEVLQELARGAWDSSCDGSHQDALSAMIPTWVAAGVGVREFALLAQYNAISNRRWTARHLLGCDLGSEIATARRTVEWREIQTAALSGKLP